MADDSKPQADRQIPQQETNGHSSQPKSSSAVITPTASEAHPSDTGDGENMSANKQALAEATKHSNASQEEAGDQEESEEDHGVVADLPPTGLAKKSNKRSRRPKSKRGVGKPTGFEDFFADAPMTPDQYEEDKELYNRNLHFVDRILTAIGRFERTRKLTPERRDLFHRYLAYGDIAIGPNNFQGGQDLKEMDKNQMAAVLSQASVTNDKRNIGTETSLYEVDFLGCAKGFLSRRAKLSCGYETRENVQLVTSTVERFMDYLLQHDVCPEYRDQVLATRNFCRDATSEIWNAAEATRRLPGDFNIGCSTLFGGSYARDYDGKSWWGPENTSENVFVGMDTKEAFQVVKFGVAGAASEDVYKAFVDILNDETREFGQAEVKEHAGFEITRIEAPSRECIEIYTANSQHFRPVGRVYAKPWENPDALPEDLTPAEQTALTTCPSNKQTGPEREQTIEYVFLVESILQSHLQEGMKVEATIRTLDCGIMFFDEVLNVYPSFDEFVLNEMMLGWKDPRPVKGAFDYVEGEDGEDLDEDGEGEGEDEINAAETNKTKGNDADEAVRALAEDVAEKVTLHAA